MHIWLWMVLLHHVNIYLIHNSHPVLFALLTLDMHISMLGQTKVVTLTGVWGSLTKSSYMHHLVSGKKCVGCQKIHFQKVCKNPQKRVSQEKTKERHRAERAVHDTQQDSDTSDQKFNIVKTKRFNFHSIRSVSITKLRIKTSQNNSRSRLQNIDKTVMVA